LSVPISGRTFLAQQLAATPKQRIEMNAKRLGQRVHFWPFDGWTPPPGRSVIAEVYPSLWSSAFPTENRNSHQHDAYCVAQWMQQSDAADKLPIYFQPNLRPAESTLAQLEGWILGLV